MTTPVSALGLSPYATTGSTAATGSTGTSGTTTSSGSTSSTSSAGLLDPQAFLQLLVAQLQYQDPTNPTDTSTFMNQTAMLSQVQTMNTMNSTLSALAGAQQAQSATGMLGKQVSYTDANGVTQTGIATAAALAPTGATLTVGGASVPLSSVTEVAEAPTS